MKFPSVPVTQKPAGEEAGSASRGSNSLKTPGHFSCSSIMLLYKHLKHTSNRHRLLWKCLFQGNVLVLLSLQAVNVINAVLSMWFYDVLVSPSYTHTHTDYIKHACDGHKAILYRSPINLSLRLTELPHKNAFVDRQRQEGKYVFLL